VAAHVPSISVALATYNGERFIREQLESILAQSLPPAEIVVRDDCSTDNTLGVVREVLSTRRIAALGVELRIVVNDKNVGPSKNFWLAIQGCSHELIALSDQDDVWMENKLEVLAAILESDPAALLVHSDAELIDSSGAALGMTLSEGLGMSEWETNHLVSGRSLPAIIRRNLVTGATAMVKRELADLAMDESTVDLHDGRLAIVASSLDGLRFCPQHLIGYRQHESNEIGGTPLSLVDTAVALAKSWIELGQVLERRNRELEELLAKLGGRISPANSQIIEDRIAHNVWRIGLPRSRVFRVWPVLWGMMRRRYKRFGRQPHDVMRDLLMPPREVLLGFVRKFGRVFRG
jgi:glycosyltransferase involved in cell wall biosynthesis